MNELLFSYDFSGLFPRLLSEALTIWLAGILSHVINTYVLKEKVSPSSATTRYISDIVLLTLNLPSCLQRWHRIKAISYTVFLNRSIYRSNVP